MKFKAKNQNYGVRTEEVNIAISYLESLTTTLERKAKREPTAGMAAGLGHFISRHFKFAKGLLNLVYRFMEPPTPTSHKLTAEQLHEVNERVKGILLPSLPSLQGGSLRQQELARRALAAIKRYNNMLDLHQVSSDFIMEHKIDLTQCDNERHHKQLIDLFRTKSITLLKDIMGLTAAIQAVNKAPIHVHHHHDDDDRHITIEQTVTAQDGELVTIKAPYKSYDNGMMKVPSHFEVIRRQKSDATLPLTTAEPSQPAAEG